MKFEEIDWKQVAKENEIIAQRFQEAHQSDNSMITNMGNGMNWEAIASIGVFLAVIFYFYPSFVAVKTKKKNKDMIFLTNMLLGWTGVVWLICLTVALMDSDED